MKTERMIERVEFNRADAEKTGKGHLENNGTIYGFYSNQCFFYTYHNRYFKVFSRK